MERNLRYVELDPTGVPFHENWKSWSDGPTEAEVWADLTSLAADRGHTLVRIAADNPRTDRNPRLDEIESDGKGGIRARAVKPEALKGVRLA